MQDRDLLMSIARRAQRIGHRVELSSNGWLNIIDPHGRTIAADLDPLEAMYRLDIIAEKMGEAA